MHEMPAELSQLHIILRSSYGSVWGFGMPQIVCGAVLLRLLSAEVKSRAALS